jgi:hypothetical protein
MILIQEAELLKVSNWLCEPNILSIQCNVTRIIYRLLCQVELNMKRSCQHFTVQCKVIIVSIADHHEQDTVYHFKIFMIILNI